jgi:hypothetical protein
VKTFNIASALSEGSHITPEYLQDVRVLCAVYTDIINVDSNYINKFYEMENNDE